MFWKLLASKSQRPKGSAGSLPKGSEKTVALLTAFFQRPEHQWIRHNRLLQNRIVELLIKLPHEDLITFIEAKKAVLAYSDGKWSCTFSRTNNESVILIFPNLFRLFLSAEFPQAQAILAHEIGHILLGHNEFRKSEMELQLEADAYAMGLGYGQELLYALQEFPATKELLRRAEKLSDR